MNNLIKNITGKSISVIVTALILITVGCNNNPKLIEKTGSDRDPHGCIASAGYTWSALKNDCVQIFAAGTQFAAYGKNADSTLAAYLIISDDGKKAEVFLPPAYSDGAIILDDVESSKDSHTSALFENKQKMIKIELSKDKYLISVKNEPVFSQAYSKTEGLGKLMH